jgi:hypothetical protein
LIATESRNQENEFKIQELLMGRPDNNSHHLIVKIQAMEAEISELYANGNNLNRD